MALLKYKFYLQKNEFLTVGELVIEDGKYYNGIFLI